MSRSHLISRFVAPVVQAALAALIRLAPAAMIQLALAAGLPPTDLAAQSSGSRPVVIYLHGRIIEEQGPNAVSPEYGPYAFRAIVDSLGAGAEVIAEQRPSGTDAERWATRVVGQVDSLIAAGVTPSRITVVGFSKGAGIAVMASARLGRTDVGFVFLAICSPESFPSLRVAGRILSVFERSDQLGQSCSGLLSRAVRGSRTDERSIDTGLGHGAFYQPRAQWLGPVRQWIAGAGETPARMDSLLGRLVGRWTMLGKIEGESVTNRLEVTRTLRHRFIEMHMADVAVPSQYEARVFLGVDSATRRYLVHWLDNFGAGASVPPGVGEARGDTIQFTFAYPSATFRDTFAYHRRDDQWHFLIESADPAGGWKVFADYRVRRRR